MNNLRVYIFILFSYFSRLSSQVNTQTIDSLKQMRNSTDFKRMANNLNIPNDKLFSLITLNMIAQNAHDTLELPLRTKKYKTVGNFTTFLSQDSAVLSDSIDFDIIEWTCIIKLRKGNKYKLKFYTLGSSQEKNLPYEPKFIYVNLVDSTIFVPYKFNFFDRKANKKDGISNFKL